MLLIRHLHTVEWMLQVNILNLLMGVIYEINSREHKSFSLPIWIPSNETPNFFLYDKKEKSVRMSLKAGKLKKSHPLLPYGGAFYNA